MPLTPPSFTCMENQHLPLSSPTVEGLNALPQRVQTTAPVIVSLTAERARAVPVWGLLWLLALLGFSSHAHSCASRVPFLPLLNKLRRPSPPLRPFSRLPSRLLLCAASRSLPLPFYTRVFLPFSRLRSVRYCVFSLKKRGGCRMRWSTGFC